MTMIKCERCGAEIEEKDVYETKGQKVCEDCSIQINSAPYRSILITAPRKTVLSNFSVSVFIEKIKSFQRLHKM